MNRTVFGSLLFAGFVDCRTLLQLVSEKELDANVAKAIGVGFIWWWPNGAKLIILLIVSGILCNTFAYYKPSQWPWLLSASSRLSIGVWTVLVICRLGSGLCWSCGVQSSLSSLRQTSNQFPLRCANRFSRFLFCISVKLFLLQLLFSPALFGIDSLFQRK